MKVFLGDQSPWGRGLLRALALKQAGIDFIYVIHDLDAPWVNVGSHEIRIVRTNKWPPYSSIKSIRVGSYTPEGKPGFSDDSIFKQQNPPKGFAYLAGGSSPETIRSVSSSSSREVISLFKEMLEEELSFYDRLTCGGAAELKEILDHSSDILEFSRRVGSLLGIEVMKISDFFREHQDFTRHYPQYPKSLMWAIDKEYRRWPADKKPEAEFYIPKGKLLPQVLHDMGYSVAATNLPYYRGNQVSISFKWDWGLRFWIPLDEYWKSYPTALSCLAVGAAEIKAFISIEGEGEKEVDLKN